MPLNHHMQKIAPCMLMMLSIAYHTHLATHDSCPRSTTATFPVVTHGEQLRPMPLEHHIQKLAPCAIMMLNTFSLEVDMAGASQPIIAHPVAVSPLRKTLKRLPFPLLLP